MAIAAYPTRVVRIHRTSLRCVLPTESLAAFVEDLHGSLPDGDPSEAVEVRLDESERSAADAPRWDVTLRGEVVRTALTATYALDFFFWYLNQQVSANPGDCLLLHAAVTACGDGAIVVTGPSGAGKTTLSCGLARRGFSYCTDEFAPVDLASGMITPVPRPLKLEGPSRDMLPEFELGLDPWLAQFQVARLFVAPRRLQYVASPISPVAPRVLVASRVVEGTGAELEDLKPSEAVLLLASQSFGWPAAGVAGFRAAVRLARECRLARLAFGDLDAAAEVLHDVYCKG